MKQAYTWTSHATARALERLGIIEQERLRRSMGLASPRIVTGFAIMSKQTADLAMVGIAVGTTATAGLAFALAFWEVVVFLGLGLSGGTISLVSQSYGAGRMERAALAVKQSILVAVAVAIPIMLAFTMFSAHLVGVLAGDPESIRFGSIYLVLVAPAVFFELLNLIASRTYTGIGDTYTEMMARGTGALVNIALSGLLIFGFGLGIAGAAIGTSVATGVVTVMLTWGMTGHQYGVLGMKPCPVTISPRGPWFDLTLTRQLIEIALPDMARRVSEGAIVFPLLWVAAAFGPLIVTAYEVGRRVRHLINSTNWGMSLAASSLVGQFLGANDENEAEAYGLGIIRLSVVIHAAAAVIVIVFSTQIASVFVTGPGEIAQTSTFVIVAAISAIGIGLDGTATGALVGAGDTRLPFGVSMLGRYVFALPVALAGVFTPLGIVGLYLALLLEAYIPGGINYGLFRSNRWIAVSRRYRTQADPH